MTRQQGRLDVAPSLDRSLRRREARHTMCGGFLMSVLAVWVGAVVVACMVISKVTSGHAFPGAWVRAGR